jgi:hypothetical protein
MKITPALLYDSYPLAIVASRVQGISLPLHLLHDADFWVEVSTRFVHSNNSAREFGLCAYQVLLEKMYSPKLKRPESYAVQRPKIPLPIVEELPELINSK